MNLSASKKILRCQKGGGFIPISLAILLCIPLVHFRGPYDSIQLSQHLALVGICTLQLVYAAVRGINQKNSPHEISINPIDGILFIWLCWILSSALYHRCYLLAPEYLNLLCYISIYMLVRTFFRDDRSLPLIIVLIMAGISTQGLYGILQACGLQESNHGHFSVTGSFFNPGPYAGFLIVGMPLVVGITALGKQDPRINSLIHRFSSGVLCILLLILPLTQSRAAWIAGIVSSMYVLWHVTIREHYVHYPRRTKKIIVFSASFLILLFSAGIIFFKINSALGRLLIWKISVGMIKENIVWGVGYGQFSAKYMSYQFRYFESYTIPQEELLADKVLYPYNEYLKILIEGGAPSLLLLLFIAFFIFRSKITADQNFYEILLRGALLALCVFALFSYPSQIIPISITFTCLVALCSSLSTKNIRIPFTMPLVSKRTKYLSIILLAIPVFYVGFYLYRQYHAYLIYNQAFFSAQSKAFNTSLKKYSEAFPFLQHNGEFMANYGITLVQAGEYKAGIRILNASLASHNDPQIWISLGKSHQALGQVDYAEKCYRTAHYMVPNRLYSLYNLALLYEETGRIEDARRIATNILNKEVKVQSGAVTQIRSRMKRILYDHGI